MGAQKTECIGRSKGGLSIKIHATCDALGNPLGFFLTGGQACDLDGAVHLTGDLEVPILLADRGYDADARVIEPLVKVGKQVVIPPKSNRKVQRYYDKSLSGNPIRQGRVVGYASCPHQPYRINLPRPLPRSPRGKVSEQAASAVVQKPEPI